jgi:hypothetical protein
VSETLDELRWLNNNINLWNDILRVINLHKYDLSGDPIEAINEIERVVKDFEFWRNELNQFKIIEGGKK